MNSSITTVCEVWKENGAHKMKTSQKKPSYFDSADSFMSLCSYTCMYKCIVCGRETGKQIVREREKKCAEVSSNVRLSLSKFACMTQVFACCDYICLTVYLCLRSEVLFSAWSQHQGPSIIVEI